jgi:hypothetical protein
LAVSLRGRSDTQMTQNGKKRRIEDWNIKMATEELLKID